mmetsp:Transcript_42553/g.118418  ORF Transcript_42553/g.118418 Transcript_42553/m.118418 type:complete len:217 (+) Transcript_42553:477-1127(+)
MVAWITSSLSSSASPPMSIPTRPLRWTTPWRHFRRPPEPLEPPEPPPMCDRTRRRRAARQPLLSSASAVQPRGCTSKVSSGFSVHWGAQPRLAGLQAYSTKLPGVAAINEELYDPAASSGSAPPAYMANLCTLSAVAADCKSLNSAPVEQSTTRVSLSRTKGRQAPPASHNTVMSRMVLFALHGYGTDIPLEKSNRATVKLLAAKAWPPAQAIAVG